MAPKPISPGVPEPTSSEINDTYKPMVLKAKNLNDSEVSGKPAYRSLQAFLLLLYPVYIFREATKSLYRKKLCI